MKASIGNKISLLTVTLVLSTALVIGFAFAYGSNNVLIKKEIDSFRSELRLKAHDFTASIDDIRSDVLFLAHTPPVAGIARAIANGGVDPQTGRSEQAWRDELAGIFMARMAVEPDYFQLRLIGVADKGRELVRVDRRDSRLLRIASADLQQKGDRDYFQDTVALKQSQVYLSRINLNREYGRVSIPHVRTLRAATPLYTEQGRLFGMVIVNLDMGHILDRLTTSTSHDLSVFIANDRGDYLAHPDHYKTFGFDLGSPQRLQDDMPDLAPAFSQPRGFAEMVLDETVQQQSELVHLLKVFFDPQQPDRFLAVVQSAPRSAVTAGATRLEQHSVLIGLLLALTGSLIALRFARLLIQPLQQITQASFLVSSGQHHAMLPVGRQDEIGVLSRALLQMLEQIKEREAALSDNQARLKAIVDTVVNGIVTIDERGIIETVNPAVEQMFGYGAEELVGNNVTMLMPRPDADRHDGYIKDYLATGNKKAIGKFRELVAQRKGGKSFPIHLAINETRIKGRRLFVGVIQDISQLQHSEERTRQLGEILESSSNEIHTFECPSLQLVESNQASRANLGYSQEQLRRMTLFDLFPRNEQFRIRTALNPLDGRQTNEHQLDTLFRRKDGSVYPVELHIFSYRGINNTVGVLIAQDITERQRQLEQLHSYAQRLESSNRELQDFAYVASHDLQEPLRKVRAFGDRLKANEAAGLSERGVDYVERMQKAAERMQTLINDLLTLSRVTSKAKPFEPVDMAQVAREVIGDLETRIHEVDGRVDVTDLPTLNADPLQMRQLLQNLIGNALKFHRPDVSPRVRVKSERLETTPDTPARYRFTVEDNGIGFDNRYAERIFTPFERLHSRQEYEGNGMGLALCKKIVERHGGTLTATSQPGSGAAFNFVLPV